MDLRYCVIFTLFFLTVHCSLEDLETKLQILEFKEQAKSYEMRLLKRTVSTLEQKISNILAKADEHEDEEQNGEQKDEDETNDPDTDRLAHLVSILLNSFKVEKSLRIKLEHEIDEKCQQLKNDAVNSQENDALKPPEQKQGADNGNYKALLDITEKRMSIFNHSLMEIGGRSAGNKRIIDDMMSALKNVTGQTPGIIHQPVAFASWSMGQAIIPPQVIRFSYIKPNIGDGLSDNGVFTVPVSGVYAFFVQVFANATSEMLAEFGSLGVTHLNKYFILNTVQKLQKNDKVRVLIKSSNDTGPIGIENVRSSFSGVLLYPSD